MAPSLDEMLAHFFVHMSSLYTLLLLTCVAPFVYLYVYGGAIGNIPGPFPAAISRLWLIIHSRRGDTHREMIRLHRKHGKLVRTGPNEVSVADLAAIKTIYGALLPSQT